MDVTVKYFSNDKVYKNIYSLHFTVIFYIETGIIKVNYSLTNIIYYESQRKISKNIHYR